MFEDQVCCSLEEHFQSMIVTKIFREKGCFFVCLLGFVKQNPSYKQIIQ